MAVVGKKFSVDFEQATEVNGNTQILVQSEGQPVEKASVEQLGVALMEEEIIPNPDGSYPKMSVGNYIVEEGGAIEGEAINGNLNTGGSISVTTALQYLRVDLSAYAGRTLTLRSDNNSQYSVLWALWAQDWSGSNWGDFVAKGPLCSEAQSATIDLSQFTSKIPKVLYVSIGAATNTAGVRLEPLIENLAETIGKLKDGVDSSLDKTVALESIPSINLYNQEDADALVGGYIAGGIVSISTSYDTSGYIPTRPNTTYYNAADAEKSFRFVNFYDENKNFISYLDNANFGYNMPNFTTPDNCAYCRVSVYAGYTREHYVSLYNLNYSPYKPNVGTNGAMLANVEQTGNTLWRKKWCVVGDSFSADFPTGKDTDWYYNDGTSKVYGRIIANRNGMELQWMAQGGRTMATPALGNFNNTFSKELYKQIDTDVDYITIYLGINDSHHAPNSSGSDGEDTTGEIPLGTIDDTTNATFYGAWNVVLPYLIEHHPFAHIGIIVSNGCETPAYREAEIAIARKYGIPYIDLNGDNRTPFMIRSQNESIPSTIRDLRTQIQAIDYAGGNTHPNKDAHEFEAHFIEQFLRTL